MSFLQELLDQFCSEKETRTPSEQLFPDRLQGLFEPARRKFIHGGRGSAKSWSVARILLLKGKMERLRIICAREFQNSLADSVHQLLADQIAKLDLPWFYRVTENEITGPNGTRFVFKGLRSNITTIKSFEGADIVWVEEAQTVSKHSWDVLVPTIRKKGSEIWITMNPDLEEDETWKRFYVNRQPDTYVRQMNWTDNPWFPDELRAEKDHLKACDLDAYYNVWEGRCRNRVVGAMWKKEIFERREPAPRTEDERERLIATFRRVVIAIDPSGCSAIDDKRSDEVGIVAVAIGNDGIGRILEDASGRYEPEGWARKGIELYDRWKADKIVAEKNFGGSMVESTIRTARRIAPIKLVTASRGKVQRAEPVASLYTQGKVRHVGFFPELERQYCLFSTAGYAGTKSPDRADAAIWGLTELMLDPDPEPNIRFFDLT